MWNVFNKYEMYAVFFPIAAAASIAAAERETNFAIINFYIYLFIYSNIVEFLTNNWGGFDM